MIQRQLTYHTAMPWLPHPRVPPTGHILVWATRDDVMIPIDGFYRKWHVLDKERGAHTSTHLPHRPSVLEYT